MLYLDDGSFPFNTTEEAATGINIIRDTFASLGLEMHCGNKQNQKLKTELIFFPAPALYTTNDSPTATALPYPTPTSHTTDGSN